MTKQQFIDYAKQRIEEGEIIYKKFDKCKNAMLLDVATKINGGIKVYNFCNIEDLDIQTTNIVTLNNNLLQAIKEL